MGGTVGIIYLVGFVAAWVILYQRAGFPDVEPDWREFLIPNLPWFGLMIAKFWFWPVTLGVWLMTGRGPSRWRAMTVIDGRPARRIVRVHPPAAHSSENSVTQL